MIDVNIPYHTCSAQTACPFVFYDPSPGRANGHYQFMIDELSTPLECDVNNGMVECQNFAPLDLHMRFTGTLESSSTTPISLNIDIIPDIQKTNLTICGQYGTIEQRMFDCSLRVQNSGTNWLLVSCADELDAQQCAWLSPLLTEENVSVQKSNNLLAGSRLLWSGVLNGEYNFFQANGKNPRKLEPAQYDYFKYTGFNSPAEFAGPIFAPGTVNVTPILHNALLDVYESAADQESVCQKNMDAQLFNVEEQSDSWEVPDYFMLLTLEEFAARTSIPGFDENFLWSSSVASPEEGWFFYGPDGVQPPSSLETAVLNGDIGMRVRCVSPYIRTL